jgi:hypothetical protein
MKQRLYEAKSVDKPSYDQRTEQEAFAETDQMANTFRKAALEWKSDYGSSLIFWYFRILAATKKYPIPNLFYKRNLTWTINMFYNHTCVRRILTHITYQFYDITQPVSIYMKFEILELFIKTITNQRNSFKTDMTGMRY